MVSCQVSHRTQLRGATHLLKKVLMVQPVVELVLMFIYQVMQLRLQLNAVNPLRGGLFRYKISARGGA